MKRTLKVVVIMMIITITMSIANGVNAFSFQANLSSNDKLVAGQEVKVTLSLSNIDMDDGIRSIKIGKITVGEEFETIATTNFSSSTWMPTYSKGGLILMSGTPITKDGVAVTLTLKVKAGITTKSSTITFEDIVASSGSNTGDIAVGTKTVTVKVDETQNGGNDGNQNQPGTNPDNPDNPGVTKPDNTQTGTNNPTQSTQKNPNSTTKEVTTLKTVPKNLPKAGHTESIVMILLVLAVGILGIISFVKYKKMR